jgi:hypothetical protein
MNRKTVLKSPADRSPEVLELEPGRPAQGNPKPRPASLQQPGESLLPIPMLEYSGFAGYRHWGINE